MKRILELIDKNFFTRILTLLFGVVLPSWQYINPLLSMNSESLITFVEWLPLLIQGLLLGGVLILYARLNTMWHKQKNHPKITDVKYEDIKAKILSLMNYMEDKVDNAESSADINLKTYSIDRDFILSKLKRLFPNENISLIDNEIAEDLSKKMDEDFEKKMKEYKKLFENW